MIKKLIGSALLVGAVVLPALAFVPDSGLKVGEMVTPFHPKHVSGPLKGTSDCPPCTYGNRPQVQVWVNGDDEKNITAIAKLLNDATKDMKKSELKTFVIFVTDDAKKAEAMLAQLAEKTGHEVALAYLAKKNEAVSNYKVNLSPDIKNTVFVYKNRTVQAKYVNLKADEKGLAQLGASVKTITQ